MPQTRGLSARQQTLKRGFDVVLSLVGLLFTGWLIGIAWVVASLDTGYNGFFTQPRVGRHGRLFKIIKIRTMRIDPSNMSSVTVSGDARITRIGAFFRRTKIDELPQLLNVLIGHMSFVGPRPDVPGFADLLQGEDRIILSLRPGITGPATLKFRNEEKLLAARPDPEAYNRDVLYPEKVRINRDYIDTWTLRRDIVLIWYTITGGSECPECIRSEISS